MTDLDLEELDAIEASIAASGRDRQAHTLAFETGVSLAEAREALEAAADILEWRLGRAEEWRVVRLAKAIIEHDRKRQGDLFEAMTVEAAP
jgi:hypothetical protein